MRLLAPRLAILGCALGLGGAAPPDPAAEPALCQGLPASEAVFPTLVALTIAGRPHDYDQPSGYEAAFAEAEELDGHDYPYPSPLAIWLGDGRFLLLTTIGERARDELAQRLLDAGLSSPSARFGRTSLTPFRASLWTPGAPPVEVGVVALAAAIGGRAALAGFTDADPELAYYGLSPAGAPPALVRLGPVSAGRIVGTSAGHPVAWRRDGDRVAISCLAGGAAAARREAALSPDFEPVSGDSIRGQRVLLWGPAPEPSIVEWEPPRRPPSRPVVVLDLADGQVRPVGEVHGVWQPIATNVPRYSLEFGVLWSFERAPSSPPSLPRVLYSREDAYPDLDPWNAYGEVSSFLVPVSLVDVATERLR